MSQNDDLSFWETLPRRVMTIGGTEPKSLLPLPSLVHLLTQAVIDRSAASANSLSNISLGERSTKRGCLLTLVRDGSEVVQLNTSSGELQLTLPTGDAFKIEQAGWGQPVKAAALERSCGKRVLTIMAPRTASEALMLAQLIEAATNR